MFKVINKDTRTTPIAINLKAEITDFVKFALISPFNYLNIISNHLFHVTAYFLTRIRQKFVLKILEDHVILVLEMKRN